MPQNDFVFARNGVVEKGVVGFISSSDMPKQSKETNEGKKQDLKYILMIDGL